MIENVRLKAGHEARDQQSREQLLAGGLPISAEERLDALRQNPGLFTSNLSVNEFALCASIGVRPLGQVTGSTVYQMGWQSPPLHSAELTYVTQAYLKARHLVFSRMQQEAALIGADGVVGVRWEMQTKIREADDLNETFRQDAYLSVAVLGTAITSAGGRLHAIDHSLPLI